MNELDDVWTQMLAEAAVNAATAGRHDVAEYLRLKATNDAIRAKGIAWLIDTMIDASSNAMRETQNFTIDRDDPHSFRYGNSTMTGTRLTLKYGVRSMSVEAGWTRAPGHGIMRDQALAVARISHFGLPKDGHAIRLVFGDDLPEWLIDDTDTPFTSDHAARHVATLLG